jgi:hypothetical protein
MTQVPLRSPLELSSEQQQRFGYPQAYLPHHQEDDDDDDDDEEDEEEVEEEVESSGDTNGVASAGSTDERAEVDDRYAQRNEVEDEDNEYTMARSGSEEVQVFEDDGSDEADRVFTLDSRTLQQQFHQQYYYQEQRLEQYRIDEESLTLAEDRPSSSSTVELLTVERWTVDNGGSPASMRLIAGTKFSDQMHRMRSWEHAASTSSTSGRHGQLQASPSASRTKYSDYPTPHSQSGATSASGASLQPISQITITLGHNQHESQASVAGEFSSQQALYSVDPTNTGIQAAGLLVQELYDQIMFHDCPAANESNALRELEQPALRKEPDRGKQSGQQYKVSSQRHDAPPPLHPRKRTDASSDGLCSFDTEETTSNWSKDLEAHRLGGRLKGQHKNQDQSQIHGFFKHLQKQPESKIGQIALGTLCSWTLDVIQPANAIVETGPISEKTLKQARHEVLPQVSPRQAPHKAGSATPRASSSVRDKASGKWKLKSYFKMKKIPRAVTSSEVEIKDPPRLPNIASEFTQNPEDHQQNQYIHDSNDKVGAKSLTISVEAGNTGEENAVDERLDLSTTPRHNDSGSRYPEAGNSPKGSFSVPTTRLQMFGSEYARFLSVSALAPRIRSPRLPQKSASSRYGPFSIRRRAPGSKVSAGIQQILSTGSFASSRPKSKNVYSSWNLEDQDNATLTGAIVDICITNGSDTPPPKGYYRIAQTVDGDEFKGALRAGGVTSGASSPRKKSSTFINVKKEPNWHRAAQRPCVTALTVIFPDRQEFVPPGFCVVREHRRCQPQFSQTNQGGKNASATSAPGGKQDTDSTVKNQPANFNAGTADGERIFLCFRRSREGNPITGILPLQPFFNEAIPDGFTVVERSPRNFVANLSPTSNAPVFLAYRQRLANLEPLRPMPLLLSVQTSTTSDEENSQMSVGSKSTTKSTTKPKLSAYYCTGGTVVEANVGRYHIMDRSTHDLLSPSSVANRLSLIELSRRKSMPKLVGEHDARPLAGKQNARESGTKQDDFNKGYTLPVRLPVPAEPTPSSQNSGSSSSFAVEKTQNVNRSFDNGSSIAEYPKSVNDSFSSRDSISLGHDDNSDVPAVILSSFPSSTQQSEGYYQKAYDAELQANHDALNFIPVVETELSSSLHVERDLLARTTLLTPILTACYHRHGGAALKAVDGLSTLVRDTDFFSKDFDLSSGRASTRLTLLDIAVQVVCDVATGGTQETTFGSCVEFVEHAIIASEGQLNTRTVGYVLRFYLFVFYFGASVPGNKMFPHASWVSPRCRSRVITDAMPILYDPRIDEKLPYLPGGAPQLAALSLKDLVTFTILRLQRVCLAVPSLRDLPKGEGVELQTTGHFIGEIISSLFDGAVHRVEVANFTQMAIHQIHRSGGSELFWHDMITSCGMGLFGLAADLSNEVQHMFVLTFALLANLVKVASGKIHTNALTYELRGRDISSKILSLELIHYFLERYLNEQHVWIEAELPRNCDLNRCVETMVFSVRRLVIPCLLANTRAGLDEPRVFQRVMKIISLLWRTPMYRDRMKGELGIMMEHFALRVLRLGPQLLQSRQTKMRSQAVDDLSSCPLLLQQLDVLQEMKRWFMLDPKCGYPIATTMMSIQCAC